MGHGLEAALLASVAVGAYRNARRRPLPLVQTVSVIEDALAAQFGRGHFVGDRDLSAARHHQTARGP